MFSFERTEFEEATSWLQCMCLWMYAVESLISVALLFLSQTLPPNVPLCQLSACDALTPLQPAVDVLRQASAQLVLTTLLCAWERWHAPAVGPLFLCFTMNHENRLTVFTREALLASCFV